MRSKRRQKRRERRKDRWNCGQRPRFEVDASDVQDDGNYGDAELHVPVFSWRHCIQECLHELVLREERDTLCNLDDLRDRGGDESEADRLPRKGEYCGVHERMGKRN